MTQTIPFPDPGPETGAPFLDCERLDCFRVAVEFQTLAADLVSLRGLGALRDQLDCASVSIVLNIAEGAGRRTPADKRYSRATTVTVRDGSFWSCRTPMGARSLP
jgi:hypothetical protein